MRLIEPDEAERLYGEMGPGIEASGGSAANTAGGVASFGGRAAYIGKVRDDQLGRVFAHDIRAMGVAFDVPAGPDGPPTGRSLILVTPDAQRTMNTCLGIAALLVPDDVDDDRGGRGRDHLLRGLPLGRRGGQAGDPQGDRASPTPPAAASPSPCPTASASSATATTGST